MTIQERVECMEKLAAGEWDGNAFHQPADKVETVVTPVEPEVMTPEAIAEMARGRAQAIANLRKRLRNNAAKLRQEATANRDKVKTETRREQSIRHKADNLENTKAWLDRLSLVPATAGMVWGGKQLLGKGMTRQDRLKGGGKALAGLAGTGLMIGGSSLIGSNIESKRQEADAIMDANQKLLDEADEKMKQEAAAIAEADAQKKEEDKSRNTERAFMRMPVVKGDQRNTATSGSTAKPSWKGFANKKK